MQLDVTTRNESQASSLLIGAYAGVKASLEWKYKSQMTDFEGLILLVYKYLDERAYQDLEYI